MQALLRSAHIKLRFSPPHCQWSNGFAERTLQDCAHRTKALLKSCGMPNTAWALAWEYNMLTRDFIPRKANPDALSPFEMRNGFAKNVADFLLPFGSTVWVVLPERNRQHKMCDVSRQGTYVGWDKLTACHRVLVQTAAGKRVLRSSPNCVLDPNLPPGIYDPNANESVPLLEDDDIFERTHIPTVDAPVAPPIPAPISNVENPLPTEVCFSTEEIPNVQIDDPHVPSDPDGDQGQNWVDEIDLDNYDIGESDEDLFRGSPSPPPMEKQTRSHSKRRAKPHPETNYRSRLRSRTSVGRIGALSEGHKIRYNLQAAMKANPTYAQFFPEAVEIETKGLIRQCLLPIKRSEIRDSEKVSTLLAIDFVKWEQGEFDKCKVRCVYRGDGDIFGLDFISKSTNMPRLSTLRIFIASSPFPNEVCGRMDCPQAFLRAPLQRVPGRDRCLVQFPKDISPRDTDGNPIIFECTHSLYGMVSAAYEWERKLFAFFRKIGLHQCPQDLALWFMEGLVVVAWVDDTPYRGTPERAAWFKKQMYQEFGDCKDKPLDWCLGLSIVKDQSTGMLGIHQADYVDYMVERFGLTNARPADSPLPPGLKMNKGSRCPDKGLSLSIQKEYQAILGCICYLASWSWPQLSYAASALGQVACAPRPAHFQYAKQVVRYCRTRRLTGLRYHLPEPLRVTEEEAIALGRAGYNTTHTLDKLSVHCDASFAQEEKYCSQSAFYIFLNGAPIHWSSVRQPFPALSSSEAEIIAGCHALRYTLHLHALMESLGKPQGVIDFCFDAKNAISFNSNDKITPRNLHIGVRFHRVRYHVGKEIRLIFVRSRYMTADIGTKSTELDLFREISLRLTHDFGLNITHVA